MVVYDEHAGPKAINSTIYGLLFPKSSNWRRFFRHILYGQESVLLSSDHASRVPVVKENEYCGGVLYMGECKIICDACKLFRRGLRIVPF